MRVLICGAGIAGPSLAYWLVRSGIDVSITIVERAPQPRVTGQAVDIRGPAIEVIRQMGLLEEVKRRHTTEVGTVCVDSAGQVFAEFMAGSSSSPGKGGGGGGSRSATAEYEILRADLVALLVGAVKDLPQVTIEYGQSIERLEQQVPAESGGSGATGGAVDVTFSRGPPRRFDVVVGADGNSSATRAMIIDEKTVRDSYHFLGQYIAFFSIPRQPDDTKLWYWYNAPGGRCIMIRPHRHAETMGAYLCMTMPSRGQTDDAIEDALHSGSVAQQKKILRQYLQHAGWKAERVLDGMDSSQDFYMSRTAVVKLPHWVSGQVALLGDAAFATFGIATSLAIQCAYLLAGELAKTCKGDDQKSGTVGSLESSVNPKEASTVSITTALKRYEDLSRSLYSTAGDLPWFFPQWVMPQSRWGLHVRNVLLWALSRTKIYKLFGGGHEADESKSLRTYEWDSPKSIEGKRSTCELDANLFEQDTLHTDVSTGRQGR